MSKYFHLPPGSIVHHEDVDETINAIWNLLVFAPQSECMKYHHGLTAVTPIFGRLAGDIATAISRRLS